MRGIYAKLGEVQLPEVQQKLLSYQDQILLHKRQIQILLNNPIYMVTPASMPTIAVTTPALFTAALPMPSWQQQSPNVSNTSARTTPANTTSALPATVYHYRYR